MQTSSTGRLDHDALGLSPDPRMYIYMRGNLLTRVARTAAPSALPKPSCAGSEKDLAILRLACLCRARNGSDYDHLEHAYQQLLGSLKPLSAMYC